jgi:phage-related protein
MAEPVQRKPLEWVASSRQDVRRFPQDVRDEIGFALFQAQLGAKHHSAKPLKGFGGAGVLEIVADDDSNTFRAVYTVKFRLAIYVLHAFQKKSTKGIKTSRQAIELINQRLKQAQAHYRSHYEKET